MLAAPDLTLTVTPPGGSPVDYSGFLSWSGAGQQLTIRQNFGRQGDTATLVLVDDYADTPNIGVIKFATRLALRDNTASKNLFAGVVTDPMLLVTAPTRNEWTLQCVDNSFYSDNALVRGVFTDATVDEIVIALTEQADCGITAASTVDGGFVAPGPQLANVSLGWDTLTNQWIKLAQLAGQVVPWGWIVDENLALHFFDSTRADSSGVTFTTEPTVAGSLVEAHIARNSSFSYEWDGSSLCNRPLVQGATQTITTDRAGPPTDTWRGDGVTVSWPLRYTLDGAPTVTLDFLPQTVAVLATGEIPASLWWVQPNANGQWFLGTSTPPTLGQVLRAWYDYDVPIIAQVNDHASQAAFPGPNHGVFARFISDSSLITAPMAIARAQRERQEYAFPVERMTWTSTEEWIGWIRAGETARVVNGFVPDSQNGYQPGIDDTYLAVQNVITFGRGGYRTMQLTAVRL